MVHSKGIGSCATEETKVASCCCDSMWSLCLGDYVEGFEEDDTINNSTIADVTTGNYSHILEISKTPQRKKPSKKVQKDKYAPEDGDKVMEYFLGTGDETSQEEGERAKQTFRRRRKKLLQSQSSDLGQNTDKPTSVPAKIVSLVSRRIPVDKYSPFETRDAADGVSLDSKSTLTAPTLEFTKEETIKVSEPESAQNATKENPVRTSEQVTSEGTGQAKKKRRSRGSRHSRNDDSPSKMKMSLEKPSMASEPFSQHKGRQKPKSKERRQSRNDKSPSKRNVPLHPQQVSVPKQYGPAFRDPPGTIAMRDPPGSMVISKRRRKHPRRLFEEDRYSHNLSTHGSELNTTRGGDQPDEYFMSTSMSRDRSAERALRAVTPTKKELERPPRPLSSWHDHPHHQRVMAGANEQQSLSNPVQRVSSMDPEIQIHHVPHVISDMSRRELELRSLGLHEFYDGPRANSNQVGGRKNGWSEKAREKGHSRYRQYHGGNESRGMVDLTSYDEFEPMPASMKLEITSRATRKQCEKSLASHRQSGGLSPSYRSSTPQRRQDDYGGEERELLTAGSLKL